MQTLRSPFSGCLEQYIELRSGPAWSTLTGKKGKGLKVNWSPQYVSSFLGYNAIQHKYITG